MHRRLTAALAASTLLSAPLLAQTAPGGPQTAQADLSTAAPMMSPVAVRPSEEPVIDVDRIVVLGFPTYDRDGVPGLSVQEFGSWMGVLFTNARQTAPASDYVAAAFSQSDVDKDVAVSSGELAAFLKGR